MCVDKSFTPRKLKSLAACSLQLADTVIHDVSVDHDALNRSLSCSPAQGYVVLNGVHMQSLLGTTS